MNILTAPFTWTWRSLKRVRALVKDQDHDDWLDEHGDRPEHQINTGIFLGPGGTGGGGGVG